MIPLTAWCFVEYYCLRVKLAQNINAAASLELRTGVNWPPSSFHPGSNGDHFSMTSSRRQFFGTGTRIGAGAVVAGMGVIEAPRLFAQASVQAGDPLADFAKGIRETYPDHAFGPELERFVTAMTKMSPAVHKSEQADAVKFINRLRNNSATSTDAFLLARSIETCSANAEETGFNRATDDFLALHGDWAVGRLDRNDQIKRARDAMKRSGIELASNDFYGFLGVSASEMARSRASLSARGGIRAGRESIVQYLRNDIAPKLAIPSSSFSPALLVAGKGSAHLTGVFYMSACQAAGEIQNDLFIMGGTAAAVAQVCATYAVYFPPMLEICAWIELWSAVALTEALLLLVGAYLMGCNNG